MLEAVIYKASRFMSGSLYEDCHETVEDTKSLSPIIGLSV